MGLLLQHPSVCGQYASTMTYVIGAACADVMDKSCVQECPVDCIYEGARSLYINPTSAWIAVRANPFAEWMRFTTKRICRPASTGTSPTTPRSSARFYRDEMYPSARLVALQTSGRSG